jgi:hypothetical protein
MCVLNFMQHRFLTINITVTLTILFSKFMCTFHSIFWLNKFNLTCRCFLVADTGEQIWSRAVIKRRSAQQNGNTVLGTMDPINANNQGSLESLNLAASYC